MMTWQRSIALSLLVVGCASPDLALTRSVGPTIDTVEQAILEGRPSNSSENASVRVIAGRPKKHACTATLVGPNVILMARHCVLRRTDSDVPSCTFSGEPTNSVGQNLSSVAPDEIEVSYGESIAETLTVKGRTLFVPDALTVCKSDIAFLVLETPLADRYAALRFAMPRVGTTFRISGWGYTTVPTSSLPNQRSSLDNVKVTEVGPGLIPPSTFAVAGGTLCFGDSGAGAIVDEAVFGVYSRIEGQACDVSVARNVFMSVAPHRALAERAFKEAGAVMWLDAVSPRLGQSHQPLAKRQWRTKSKKVRVDVANLPPPRARIHLVMPS